HRVSNPAPGAQITELKLFGGRLAIALNTGHSLGGVQAWLQDLDGSHRHLVKGQSQGEADRAYVGLSFDGGAFYFAQICMGDPSACRGHRNAYRYAGGKLTSASIPLDVGGFAQAGGQSYWVTENYGSCVDTEANDAPCVVQREALAFN